jgi:glycosyltransferase involved in cell wall biosynthesis
MSEEKPAISIIVPVYNVEKYLHQCVDSILAQTFKDFELILVDDGSPDNCPGICDQYAARDNRICVIHKQNGGLISAWKAGFKMCNGQYVGFVDSDDWVDIKMYEQMYNAILTNNADIVQCDIIREPSKSVIGVCRTDKTYIFDETEIIKHLLPRMLTYWETDGLVFANSRCNKLIKRDLVATNIEYCDDRISYGEDLNLMLPVVLDCKKAVCIPGCYYHYRFNPNSIFGTSYKDDYWQQSLMLVERIKNIAEHKKVRIDDLCHKLFNYMAIVAIENEWKSPHSTRQKIHNTKIIMHQNPAKKFISRLRLRKQRLILYTAAYIPWVRCFRHIYTQTHIAIRTYLKNKGVVR